jgi:hypothetical protein
VNRYSKKQMLVATLQCYARSRIVLENPLAAHRSFKKLLPEQPAGKASTALIGQ